MKLKIKEHPSEFVEHDLLVHQLLLEELTTNGAGLEISYDEGAKEMAFCTSDECVFIPKKALPKVKKAIDELFARAGVK